MLCVEGEKLMNAIQVHLDFMDGRLE